MRLLCLYCNFSQYVCIVPLFKLMKTLILSGPQTKEKEAVFDWVPGHVGIKRNSAADTAAEDALDGDISDEFAPFSDLKPRMNQYI